jgi:hypothetical protein
MTVQRERIEKEMDQPSTTWQNEWLGSGGDGSGIMLVGLTNPELAKYEGMTLQEIGRQWKKDPKDVAMEIVIADHGHTGQITSIMALCRFVRTGCAYARVRLGSYCTSRNM